MSFSKDGIYGLDLLGLATAGKRHGANVRRKPTSPAIDCSCFGRWNQAERPIAASWMIVSYYIYRVIYTYIDIYIHIYTYDILGI